MRIEVEKRLLVMDNEGRKVLDQIEIGDWVTLLNKWGRIYCGKITHINNAGFGYLGEDGEQRYTQFDYLEALKKEGYQ